MAILEQSITIRVAPEFKDRIREVAKADKRSVSAWSELALWRELQKAERRMKREVSA